MSMSISGLSSFRVETEWPCAIDIERDYESILAQVFLAPESNMLKAWKGQQIKVLLKENCLGVFISPYPDSDVPAWWQDADVIWQYDQRESMGDDLAS